MHAQGNCRPVTIYGCSRIIIQRSTHFCDGMINFCDLKAPASASDTVTPHFCCRPAREVRTDPAHHPRPDTPKGPCAAFAPRGGGRQSAPDAAGFSGFYYDCGSLRRPCSADQAMSPTACGLFPDGSARIFNLIAHMIADHVSRDCSRTVGWIPGMTNVGKFFCRAMLPVRHRARRAAKHRSA